VESQKHLVRELLRAVVTVQVMKAAENNLVEVTIPLKEIQKPQP